MVKRIQEEFRSSLGTDITTQAASPHFCSSSAGNAGLACVTAATALGYKSTVVIPTTTEPGIVTKLYVAGASDVITCGESWHFADVHLRTVVMPAVRARGDKPIYIHPFNDPLIWEGASSIVDEIKAQMPPEQNAGGSRGIPDAIVCSVGGGGLFTGIMQGLHRHGWLEKGTKVLAVETYGADSLAHALQQGRLISLPRIDSVADSLGAIRVAEETFSQASRSPNAVSVVLDDALACEACWRFLDDERMLVEPACGVSLALAYNPELLRRHVGNNHFGPESKVVIVVCGGSKISLSLLNEYRHTYSGREEEAKNGKPL